MNMAWLRSLTLKTRLYVMLAGMLLGLLVLGGYSVYQLRQAMLEEKRMALRALVESGMGVIQQQYDLMQAGQLTEEEAKRRAKDDLRKVRYQGSEYFFIYDLNGVNVMHGSKPEREGKSFIDQGDAAGKLYIKEWVGLLKANGDAYMDYMFSKLGEKTQLPKLSYAKVFAPWGWWLGTGIYITDVEAQFRAAAVETLVFVAVAALVLGVLGWAINHSVRQEIGGEPAQAARQVGLFAEGDLTQRIESSSTLPGNLLGALAGMQQQLSALVRGIHKDTQVLVKESGELSVAAKEISLAARNQADSSAATAASIEQLTVSINEVSEIARQTEGNSSKTADLARSGTEVVGRAAHEIENIAASLRDSAERVHTLVGRSQEISSITNVIKDIADQTNLLALNAAIEAARAGEQGRGFAVVADEVRKLAERTSQATAEINEMVMAIQSDTESAVQSMESARPRVEQGQELARQATAVLGEIEGQARDSLEKVRDVARATKEQAGTANGIAGHVERIASMTEETNATTQANAEAAEQLKAMAAQLMASVAHFKV